MPVPTYKWLHILSPLTGVKFATTAICLKNIRPPPQSLLTFSPYKIILQICLNIYWRRDEGICD